MEDKIAVHCKAEKDWDKIVAGFTNNKGEYPWKSYGTDSCLNIEEEVFCGKSYYEEEGYTIISAAEYLNEGGKDVSEFKKGTKVEILKIQDDRDEVGNVAEVIMDHGDGAVTVKFEDGSSWYYSEGKVKLTTKTQTTKENNMELNSSIRTVLVEENGATFETVEKFQKVFGSEIAENFTGAMILRKNIKTYNDEIKRLDDIEAKRLEKEEKDK